jgi:SAM-dependent methyltransferase
MPDDLKSALAEFARFARTLRGDEKSESQIFLDHFFRALGHSGVQEAGATLEYRIEKKPGTAQLELIKGEATARPKGGKKFADLLWPDRVLIEMKSRGANLEKHYDQVFDYWTHVVPKRPPYVILCNFDEFWIYDFNTQLFDPVDRVPLSQLAGSISAFNFLLPEPKRPIFENNRVEVTRRAADLMARVFRALVARGEDRARSQRFILQLLVSMVAEDIGLLPREIVTELLFESSQGRSSYDLFGGLFQQMASPDAARGGRFQEVRYFNGGLFADVESIELKLAEVYGLHEAALHNDWSKVKPEIFGTLFQQSMDTGADAKGKKIGRDERHAYGAHFTSEFDIQKVVGPSIVRPWRERIEAAGKSVTKLREALADLRRFRVLDPACGSGNFLFVAYREMKRLERDLLLRLRETGRGEPLESAVSVHQFFGLDVLPFAVELAKVTLMLAKELEVNEAKKIQDSDQLLIEEKPLPLDNLDKNIVCADALFTEWPKVDAIIGNPPFQSKNKAQKELGVTYLKKLRAAYPSVPGRADYCVYWLKKAHDHLLSGQRAGLVGTNTIRQNYSRQGGLDYIVSHGGTITDAVGAQVWSGDAVVNVAIVNWINGDAPGPFYLSIQRGDHVDSPWDRYSLAAINSSLSPRLDVVSAIKLETNAKAPVCFQGQTHGHEGFLLQPAEALSVMRKEPNSAEVLHWFFTGEELINKPDGAPERFVIDFGEVDIFVASSYPLLLDRVRTLVQPDRIKAVNEEEERNREVLESNPKAKVNKHHANFLKRWWRMSYRRKKLMDRLAALPRYVACVRLTRRPIFEFISSTIHPNDALQVFAVADDYSFGVLQSSIHWQWFNERCSTLKVDFRYTSDTVFDTFPWPQTPPKARIAEVTVAAVSLRKLRREVMGKHGYSLRDLYRTLEEPGANPLRDAHYRLDTSVRAAYGMSDKADPLAFLLELNLACAANEKASEKITPPGLPLPLPEHARFITDDCIQPPQL